MQLKCFHFFLLVLFLCINSALSQETLRSLATKRGVYIGAAVGSAMWGSDSRYKAVLQKEFNILVPENAMKFAALETSQNKFNWTRADEIVDFAVQNRMAIRGHTLVWHTSSGWVENAFPNLSRAQVSAILKNHIDSVLTHFRGKILEWDVVNEAIDDSTGGLRNTFWRTSLGDNYLDSVFIWAHKADPKAILFYNDYYNEGMTKKSDAIYNMVKSMRERGVPVQGVGLQCHIQNNVKLNTADIDRNIKRLAALGLRVSITEVDFIIQIPADTNELNLQKRNYHDLLSVCLANDSCKSFLTWGFTDAHSWIPNFIPGSGASLPFDEDYNKKPAYYGLMEALEKTPVSSIHLAKSAKLDSKPYIRLQNHSEIIFRRNNELNFPSGSHNSLGKKVPMHHLLLFK